MTAPADLIAKLEAAEGGSRELDALVVSTALGWKTWLEPLTDFHTGKTCGQSPVVWDGKTVFEASGRPNWESVPEVTTSIDAALAWVERVLPGWEVAFAQRKPRPQETCAERWNATLFAVTSAGIITRTYYHEGKHRKGALALCIAALRALAALAAEGE